MCEKEKIPSCPVKPEHKRVGYAYVPVQELGKVYQPCTALEQGTVFPELNICLDEYERGLWCGK